MRYYMCIYTNKRTYTRASSNNYSADLMQSLKWIPNSFNLYKMILLYENVIIVAFMQSIYFVILHKINSEVLKDRGYSKRQ